MDVTNLSCTARKRISKLKMHELLALDEEVRKHNAVFGWNAEYSEQKLKERTLLFEPDGGTWETSEPALIFSSNADIEKSSGFTG